MSDEPKPDQAPEPGSYPFPASESAEAGAPSEKEWWDDPGLPWRQKPTRSDIACLGWIGFMGLFGLALLPLRAWLLGLDPAILVSLTGSRSGSAALGALHRVDASPWWWWLALIGGVAMSVKFDWVFWWAGKLWGQGMIEVWGGRSDRAKRNYDRVTRWAEKWGAVGVFLAYVPIPLPMMQVIFVVAGASKMSVKKFMLLDVAASMSWLSLYFSLGFAIGEPAVAALKAYAKVSTYVAMGLIVFILGSYYWNGARKKQPQA